MEKHDTQSYLQARPSLGKVDCDPVFLPIWVSLELFSGGRGDLLDQRP